MFVIPIYNTDGKWGEYTYQRGDSALLVSIDRAILRSLRK